MFFRKEYAILVKRSGEAGQHIFEWDNEGQLTTSKPTGGETTEYCYDASGRRVQKKTGNKTTEFYWDGDVLLGDKVDGKVREFVYYPGTFEPFAMIKNGEVYFYNNDINGAPLELFNDDGKPVWSTEYSALGEVTKTFENSVDNPLRLQGQYCDEETGLHYNRHRYYDPKTGSFISKDPIGLEGGTNPYQYAPNVWEWSDPLGLTITKCDIDSKSDSLLAKPGEDLYIGTYSKSKYWNRKTKLNSTHTPHHVVQNAVSLQSHGRGITINIRQDLHANLETTGSKRKLNSLREHLAADIRELRQVLRDAGYDHSTISRQLYELIKQNKKLGGFSK